MLATLQGRSGVSGLLGSSEFYLPLYDAGAGVVDTTLTRGQDVATFVRATVAWTKLSTGLWASVASGSPRSSYIGMTTAVGAYGGYFSESAGIQLVTPTASIRDMTDAAWTATNITAAKTGIGIDGVANSCSRLTATASDGTIFQTLTAAASSRTYSVWLKRVTGTGTISLTQDGGSTYTDVTASVNSSTFTRVELTASVLNAAFGIKISTDTDVILADFNQFEAGPVASSPMDSAGAARNADVLTYVFAGNADTAVGSCYAEMYTTWAAGTAAIPVVVGFGSNVQTPLAELGSGISTQIRIRDGTNTATKSSLASTATGVRKRASSWGGAGMVITGDGGAVGTGSFDGDIGSTSIAIGCIPAGTNQLYGTIKNVRIWTRQLPNIQLPSITT